MSVVGKRAPRFHVGSNVSFLFGPEKVSGIITEDRGPLGIYGRRIYGVRMDLGEGETMTFELPEEDMEESTGLPDNGKPGTRREYSVIYVRRGKTNRWIAKIKRGGVYQGVAAKGAVAYTTGRWEGEPGEDESHGIVSVLLEPRQNDSEAAMAEEARHLADEMFVRRHQNAEFEN